MWTEPRYPNNTALMARPHARANVHLLPWFAVRARARTAAVAPVARSFAPIFDMPWLPPGGKVIPQGGQEHPRTEL